MNDFLESKVWKGNGDESSENSQERSLSIKDAVHNSAEKNLYLTKRFTRRKQKQNLLFSTISPFVFK